MGGLVGREEELGALTASLARAAAGASASCAIEGEVGIGKTTLLEAALEFAAERHFLVLRARPVEAETAFSFAALADLLGPALTDVLHALPAPQKIALETALLIDEGAGHPPDPHAVSAATLTTFQVLAKKSPVVVAIDDAQWLDSPSRITLQFTARRLPPRMALLTTERIETERTTPTFSVEGERLRLGPLSPGALQQLIHRRLDVALSRPALLRVHEASAGHPFFALEIARALRASGEDVAAVGPLPVPANLRQLVARRLGAISVPTRRTLIAVAASARPGPDLVADNALAEAVAADVLVRQGDRIRFTHPLLGSVVYADAMPAERRAVHARLAERASDEEEAARHLGLASDGPDETVAARLEGAAQHANARGAPSAAAELMELARALTPNSYANERIRRAVDTADFHVAGRTPGADRLLEEVLPATSGDLRARALQLLGFWRSLFEWNAAIPYLDEALTHVRDPELELRIRLDLIQPSLRGVTDRTPEHAERAVELARQVGDRGLEAAALAYRAVHARRPLIEMERAAEMEEGSRSSVHARLELARSRLMRGSAVARGSLRDLLDVSNAAGLRAHNWVMSVLALAETRAGDPRRAKQVANEFLGYALSEQNALAKGVSLSLRSYAEAWLGEHADARRDAEESIRQADAGHYAARSMQSRAVLGFVELCDGKLDRAAEHLSDAIARFLAADPSTIPPGTHALISVPVLFADTIETFAQLGRLDETAPLIAWLERDADKPWRIALAAYGRGLIAAAGGDEQRALAELADAAAKLESLALPLDEARALLHLGTAQRRARRRAEARRSLERALAMFEHSEASAWAAIARRELARVAPGPTAGELTQSERRVAGLVALGRSNKEVAAELSISTKTVEGHLANIYAKLGVSSRSELAHRFASERSPTP